MNGGIWPKVAFSTMALLAPSCEVADDPEARSPAVDVQVPSTLQSDQSLRTTSPIAAGDARRAIPPTTPPTKVGDRGNPVPIGGEARFTNGWIVKVNSVTTQATQVVLGANRFNDPPPSGSQFVLVNVTAAYTGPGSRTILADLDFSAVDAGNTEISEGRCGVVPDDLNSISEVFTGGALTGNLCFVVATSTIDSLVMYVDAGLFSRERVFFGLR